MPPYNGFGSEEDSLASCLSLRPKPPRRDFKKFMEKDRCEFNTFTPQSDPVKPGLKYINCCKPLLNDKRLGIQSRLIVVFTTTTPSPYSSSKNAKFQL